MQVTREGQAEFDLDEFLTRPLLAFVSSVGASGPRCSVYWYLWEEQALWMIAEKGYNSLPERIAHDDRVAVSIAQFDPVAGTIQHASLRGVARVEPWDDDRGHRLLTRYYAHIPGYRERKRSSGSRVTGRRPMEWVRVDPESVLLRDYCYREEVLSSARR